MKDELDHALTTIKTRAEIERMKAREHHHRAEALEEAEIVLRLAIDEYRQRQAEAAQRGSNGE